MNGHASPAACCCPRPTIERLRAARSGGRLAGVQRAGQLPDSRAGADSSGRTGSWRCAASMTCMQARGGGDGGRDGGAACSWRVPAPTWPLLPAPGVCRSGLGACKAPALAPALPPASEACPWAGCSSSPKGARRRRRGRRRWHRGARGVRAASLPPPPPRARPCLTLPASSALLCRLCGPAARPDQGPHCGGAAGGRLRVCCFPLSVRGDAVASLSHVSTYAQHVHLAHSAAVPVGGRIP